MLRPLARLSAAAATLGICLTGLPAVAEDGPIVGTPPPEDAVQGWIEGWTDPDYWSSYVHDAVLNGHVNVPYPVDPVKPEAYLPNVPVADGRYVSSLPVAHRDLSGITYTYGGQTKTIEQFVRTTRTDQVVLVHDGVVVGEFYANGFTADTRHQAWSVTKTFVAAVVGIALHEGRIGSLQDPIEQYVPRLRGTEWEGVSIKDILQMESGVHWDEDTPVLAVNTQVEQWRDLALDLYTDGRGRQDPQRVPRHAAVDGVRAGHPVPLQQRQHAGARVDDRAALRHDVREGPPAQALAADGRGRRRGDDVRPRRRRHRLPRTVRPTARLRALRRAAPQRRQDLRRQACPAAAWVEAMTTMTKVSGGKYGLQTWAHPIAAPDAFSASGFQGQKITVLPSDCLTAVRTSHAFGADLSDGAGTEFYAEEWQTMLRAVADALGGCPRGR